MSNVAVGQTKKRLQTGKRDRLSELPTNLIEHILESMPIQDAIRTSALSRSWRYNWTTISKLIFDERFYSHLVKKKLNTSYHMKCIISDVFMVHNASLSHFHIICGDGIWESLGHHMFFLLRKGVKNLILDTGHVTYNKLPSHIFSFEQLTHLKIRFCHFLPPFDSTGFPNLIMLELKHILFEGVSSQHFITCCPKLESLKLLITRNSSEFLTIYSPSLKHLDVRGHLHSIQISAEGLETVILIPRITENGNPQTPVRNIFAENCMIPRIQKLAVGGHALELLTAATIPRKLPTLENMKLLFKFEDPTQVFAAIGLIIRSTPNLQKLEIWVMNCQDPITPVSSSFGDDVTLSCLKIVKFCKFTGSDHELEMIKSILACSPSLEKLFLEGAANRMVGGNDGRSKFIELMRFRRVSPKAEIIYSETI